MNNEQLDNLENFAPKEAKEYQKAKMLYARLKKAKRLIKKINREKRIVENKLENHWNQRYLQD